MRLNRRKFLKVNKDMMRGLEGKLNKMWWYFNVIRHTELIFGKRDYRIIGESEQKFREAEK